MGRDGLTAAGRKVAPKSGRERQHRTRRRRKDGGKPFRFLDLPTELRHSILSLAVHCSNSRVIDVLGIFLTCHAIYNEAASIYYYNVVVDTRGAEAVSWFLSQSLRPRLHVRNLTIRFYFKEQLQTFQDTYGLVLRNMADEGNLKELRLEISYKFPSSSFWGGKEGDTYYDDVALLTGQVKDKEIQAPITVTKAPFQYFLRLLADKEFQNIRLFVDAEEHPQFWCAFHRRHPSGGFGGNWGGDPGLGPTLLEIRWKTLVHVFLGARPVDSTTSEI